MLSLAGLEGPLASYVVPHGLSSIRRGGLCVQPAWLSADLLAALRDDITDCQGSFAPSGLTPRLTDDSRHLFGAGDRRVCVLETEFTETSARASVGAMLESLRLDLERVLGRQLTLEESYYSLSSPGTDLPLHLDEHHPATKHTPTDDAATRRSVSFLLYLSEPSLTGGELRAFHRTNVGVHSRCGAHEGDLQVGWLERAATSPVFLDAWVPPAWMSERRPAPSAALSGAVAAAAADATAAADAVAAAAAAAASAVEDDEDAAARYYDACQPSSRLYVVDSSADESGGRGGSTRTYLTEPIAHDDAEFCGAGLESDEFVERLRGRLPASCRAGFSGVADWAHPSQRSTDVSAVGGTLVLFDSVCVPHKVLPITAGERLALGGWFHEAAQDYPAWFEEAF